MTTLKPLGRGTVQEAKEGARGGNATREENRQEEASAGGGSTRETKPDEDWSASRQENR
jgi:hypothetical protein